MDQLTDAYDKQILQSQRERFSMKLTDDGRELHDADGKQLVAGARVQIFGLRAKPALNNTFGRVVTYQAARGRFGVQLESLVYDARTGHQTFMWSNEPPIAIKHENLRAAPRLPAAVGTAAGSRRDYARNIEYVIDWLDSGGDIEARCPVHNDTLLTLACASGSEALVGELLRRGADVEAAARSQTTALMYTASLTGSVPIAKLLLDAGASVGKVDDFGRDALYKATDEGHKALAKLLREHGAAVTSQPPMRVSDVPTAAQAGTAIYWTDGICAGCEKPTGLRPGFQCCPRCVSAKLSTPAQFCSKQCFEAHWRVHKRWHAAHDERSRLAIPKASPEATAARQRGAEAEKLMRKTKKKLDQEASRASGPDGEYGRLLSRAMEAFMSADHLQCKKLCQRAIAIDPAWWAAHALLGDCHRAFVNANYGTALAAHLKAVELTGPGSGLHREAPDEAAAKHAGVMAAAYADAVMIPDGKLPSDLPKWMTDRSLLLAKAGTPEPYPRLPHSKPAPREPQPRPSPDPALFASTDSIVAAIPEHSAAHTMRANAFVNRPSRAFMCSDDVSNGVVTSGDFRESAKSWARAAELAENEEDQAIFAANATSMNGEATRIDHVHASDQRRAAGLSVFEPVTPGWTPAWP